MTQEMPRREAMRRHAIRRFKERFGEMGDALYQNVCRSIRAGAFPIVGRDATGNDLYAVPVNGKTVVAVWSDEYLCIKTFVHEVRPHNQLAPAGETALAAALRSAGVS